MNLLPPLVIHRSPTFTLGTALSWLGHDCAGLCPTEACTWRASAWYVVLPPSGTWTRTLVDVDFAVHPWPDHEIGTMLSAINHCIRPDHIRVRERSPRDRAGFVAALSARRPSV